MIFVMKYILTIMFFLCSASQVRADIYKHISADGVIYFSNTSSGASSTIVIKERKVPLKIVNEHNPVHYAMAPHKVGDFSGSRSMETFHAAVDEKAKLHNIDP